MHTSIADKYALDSIAIIFEDMCIRFNIYFHEMYLSCNNMAFGAKKFFVVKAS